MMEDADGDEFVTPYAPYVPYEAPTIPTLQGGLARCARCRSMFMEGSADACVYHPGVYRGGVTCRPPHGVARHGWSCCNGEAGSVGCTRTPRHVVCQTTARSLSRFPVSDHERIVTPRQTTRPSVDLARVVEAACVEHHVVGVGETLAAIALRYHTNMQQLMRLNRLHSPNVFPGQRLRVAQPVSSEVRVRESVDCTAEEASFYLEAAGGNVAEVSSDPVQPLARPADDAPTCRVLACRRPYKATLRTRRGGQLLAPRRPLTARPGKARERRSSPSSSAQSMASIRSPPG